MVREEGSNFVSVSACEFFMFFTLVYVPMNPFVNESEDNLNVNGDNERNNNR